MQELAGISLSMALSRALWRRLKRLAPDMRATARQIGQMHLRVGTCPGTTVKRCCRRRHRHRPQIWRQ